MRTKTQKRASAKCFGMKKDKAEIVFDFADMINEDSYPAPLARTALCLASAIQRVPKPIVEELVSRLGEFSWPRLVEQLESAIKNYKYHDGKTKERALAGRRCRRARRQLFSVLSK